MVTARYTKKLAYKTNLKEYCLCKKKIKIHYCNELMRIICGKGKIIEYKKL